MPIRSIGSAGEKGEFLLTTMAPIATYRATTATNYVRKGAWCVLSTSGNWAVNSAASGTALELCGRIVELSPDSTVATVQWFGYNKAVEQLYSGTVTLGHHGLSAGTAAAPTAKASSYAAQNRDSVCVSIDTGTVRAYFLTR